MQSLWVRDLDSLEARPLPRTENASYPFWSLDSRTVGFFADGDLKTIDASGGSVMAAPIVAGAAIEVGSAVPLFSQEMLNGPTTLTGLSAQYDVAPDGQQFLLNVPVEETRTQPSITVVLNWASGIGVSR